MSKEEPILTLKITTPTWRDSEHSVIFRGYTDGSVKLDDDMLMPAKGSFLCFQLTGTQAAYMRAFLDNLHDCNESFGAHFADQPTWDGERISSKEAIRRANEKKTQESQ